MTWFRNLNTSRKLAIAFGILELLMIGLALFSVAQLSRVNATTVQVISNQMPLVRALGNLKYDTAATRRAELSLLLAVDHKDKWQSTLNQSLSDLQRDEHEYRSLISSDEEQRRYDAFSGAWQKYLRVHAQVMELTTTNEYQAGVLAQSEGNEAFEAAVKILQEEVDLSNQSALKKGAQAAQVYTSSRYWIIGLLICALSSGFVMSNAIGRGIAKAVSRMLLQMQHIAANNLAVNDVEIESQDEIGKAGLALNQMKNNLCKVIQVISGTAQQLASASEEISAGAGQAAVSARSQADKTSHVATAAQQMAATVQQVSENSQKASATSQQSAQAARRGGSVAEETLATMQSISESTTRVAARITELGKSSEQIGRIVAVINDIADQTNLLALNAAIEAARAGEQGRGFAVVADEVRKLAERTTKATGEIASMVESIQSETKSAVEAMELSGGQVQAGVERTGASRASLQTIIQMSEEVGNMIMQIATAAGEQSKATDDITSSISQIAGLTQQSSSAAEETARACTDLSSLALDLQELVGQFKLAEIANQVHPAEKTSIATQPDAGMPKAFAAAGTR